MKSGVIVCRIGIVIGILVFPVCGSFAEDNTARFQETTQDFLNVFESPVSSALPQGRTKGLQPKGPAAVVDDYEKLIENPTARSLILFDFDSEAVKQGSYVILKNFAEALRELPDSTFVIVGHTDASGSDSYNLDLSQRRAESVKQFLIAEHHIAPERLQLQWYGERHLLLPQNPDDGQNRRVEFVRVK